MHTQKKKPFRPGLLVSSLPRVLQCVAVCCSVLFFVAAARLKRVYTILFQRRNSVASNLSLCCSALQLCVAVHCGVACCSALQCGDVCCSE